MKINTITKSACNILRDEINKHLESLGIEGIVCKLGTGRFNADNVTFKLEVALVNGDGKVQNRQVTDWSIYCHRWLMAADDLGKQFKTFHGDIVTITGCKPQSYKYPILARNAAGKVHKYPPRALRAV